MIGQLVRHYKILEKLGEGGMGVVYKAEDTTLDRLVALKFLPPSLHAGEQEKARFLQEAKSAAALNHPNICSVIAIDESEGQMFIVMEYIDGQTLREKMGSIGLKQAIDIGIQIADGLAAAHERGIVHRDIKPENIMIRKDGIAQIMDFGLAKLRAGGGSKVTRLTKEGSTVGTAGYMSPEQVQGHETDHRSDIFSFGVLLYEMLAGQLPFRGVHETALLYEIVNVDPPPMASLKPDLDPAFDAIVLDCLEKDPKERCQSIAEVARDLRRLKRESSRQRATRTMATRQFPQQSPAQAAGRPEEPKRPIMKFLWPAVAALLLIAVIALLVMPRQNETGRIPMRFSINLPANAPLFGGGIGLAISPDGKYLVYSAQIPNSNQLYLHRMDQSASEPIPGTVNTSEPSFSPDGQWVVYNEALQKLMKVPVFGGAPQVVCATSGQTRGIWWAADNMIYYGHISNRVYRVSANGGGTPEAVTTLDSAAGEISHRFPQVLPDGKTIIYTIKQSTITTFDDAVIVAQRIGTNERKVLVRGGSFARYIPTGHLMYIRGNSIYAVPFDAGRLEVKGTPVAVEDGGWMNRGSGSANIDFSAAGTLVFAPTGAYALENFLIAWIDRLGKTSSLVDTLGSYSTLRLSPDGQKIAVTINAANDDIWVYQIPRGTFTRVTFGGGNNDNAIWSPDGKYVIYNSEKGRMSNIFRKPWDGSGAEERLTDNPNFQTPTSFTPDGKTLAYDQNDDIWVLPLENDRTPRPFIQSPATENGGMFSPDGRWMAYTSNESGKFEVYVTAFPKRDGKWQISNGGGAAPAWSRDGKQLFYSNGTAAMAVDVLAGQTFDFSVPRKLFNIPSGATVFDVSPDGQRFLIIATAGTQLYSLPRLEVVVNWFDRLRQKFATNRE